MEGLSDIKDKNLNLIKENPEFYEAANKKNISFNKLKAEFLIESVPDEEKEISSKDSFNSDLSQSKNYIPKEAWLMRNSGSFVNNSINYNVKSQRPNFINLLNFICACPSCALSSR